MKGGTESKSKIKNQKSKGKGKNGPIFDFCPVIFDF